MYMIPDETNNVSTGKLKYKYDSMEALKKDVYYFKLHLK